MKLPFVRRSKVEGLLSVARAERDGAYEAMRALQDSVMYYFQKYSEAYTEAFKKSVEGDVVRQLREGFERATERADKAEALLDAIHAESPRQKIEMIDEA